MLDYEHVFIWGVVSFGVVHAWVGRRQTCGSGLRFVPPLLSMRWRFVGRLAGRVADCHSNLVRVAFCPMTRVNAFGRWFW